ncbi:unnamed protein product [Umbelopsis sp. WA50703]
MLAGNHDMRYGWACIYELNIPGVEATIKEESQPMDIDEEDASTEAALVPLGTLMDIDTSVELQQVPSVAAPTVVLESSMEKERARNPTEPYRRYTTHQIEQSCNYVIEQGKTAKDAAFLSRINIRTAQCYGLEVQVNASKTKKLPVTRIRDCVHLNCEGKMGGDT